MKDDKLKTQNTVNNSTFLQSNLTLILLQYLQLQYDSTQKTRDWFKHTFSHSAAGRLLSTYSTDEGYTMTKLHAGLLYFK